MADVDVDAKATIFGLDNIHATYDIRPLDIKTDSKLAVTQPIVTDSKAKTDSNVKTDSTAKLALAIDPLKIESDQRSEIDLKPLAVDACQTIKLAPLPETCIEQPFEQHFGFTLFGMEIWGFNVSGKSSTNLKNGDRHQCHSTGPHGECHDSKHHHHDHHHHHRPESEYLPQPGGGLRVRVGGGAR
jgi:hypothetical protein